MLSPELWGVMIGAGIGIVTTGLGFLYNWKLYRHRQRFDLRQRVYIEAAAAMARNVEYLASVWRTDLDEGQLAQMLYPGTIAANKIQVVGTQTTIDALARASESFGVSALELMKARAALQAVQARVAATEAEVAQSRTYLQQLASMIDGLPRSAPTTEVLATIPGLVREFTGARDRVLQGQARLDAASRERLTLQKQLLMDGMKAAVQYQQELLEVNIAARRELDLPLDEARYRSDAKKSAERMIAVVERTIKELEAGGSAS